MYIVEVIPLQKGIPRDTLSYFSMREIPLGALVEVPLQSRTIQGIVIRQDMARDLKASIRTGDFSLKSVTSVINERGFPVKIIQTLQKISERTTVPIGTLLVQLFPEPVFTYFHSWKPITASKNEIRIITLPTSDRFEYYKLLVRESFAKKQSIHFVCSTVIETETLAHFLEKENPSRTVITIHGGKKDPAKKSFYTVCMEHTAPVIICSTPQFCMIPRNDIGSCVMESFQSPHYIQDFTRTIDYRYVVLLLAEALGYIRYVTDSLLIPEFSALLENRKGFIERETKKQPNHPPIHITEKENLSDRHYQSAVFSSETIQLIKKAVEKNQSVFIFSNRKNIATATTCRDCGFTVTCPNCTAVMHLIKKNPLSESDRVFFCNRCTTEIPPMNRCPVCLGWNLIPLGITHEAIKTEVKKFFPAVHLFESNQQTTKTESACKKLIKEWQSSCGVLIGTEKIIPYIPETSVTIIASFEQLMSIPSFTTPIHAWWVFQKLLEKTKHYFVIQTKNKNQEFLEQFKNQDAAGFVAGDVQLRKQLLYPPYGVYVVITLSDISRKDHHQAKEFLKKSLSLYEHFIQSQFFEQSQQYQVTGTLHIPLSVWESNSPEKQRLTHFLSVAKDYADVTIL